MLKTMALTGGAFLAACTPATPPPPEKIEVTKVVEKAVEVTKVVEKPVDKVITATPPPKGVVTIRATTNMTTKIWETLVPGKFKDLFPTSRSKLTRLPLALVGIPIPISVITRIAGGDNIDELSVSQPKVWG